MRKKSKTGAPGQYLRETVFGFERDECLFWPFGTSNGYAVIGKEYVHRMVCEHANGPSPSPKHHAAHSCGNGHLACVSKRHLSWKTAIENAADRKIHGTEAWGERNGHARLSAADVAVIRGLNGTMMQKEIAKMFGICNSHVSVICSGGAWKHTFTQDQANTNGK